MLFTVAIVRIAPTRGAVRANKEAGLVMIRGCTRVYAGGDDGDDDGDDDGGQDGGHDEVFPRVFPSINHETNVKLTSSDSDPG